MAFAQRFLLEVEAAIITMGTTTFYRNLFPDFLVEDRLKSNIPALTNLLKLIKRAHLAAYYAADWAALHKDLHSEETWIATLLHDFAEMLMWCFAPEKMNTIFDMLKKDKSLRGKDAQAQVLGFHLSDLQKELINGYAIPSSLMQLIEEDEGVELVEVNALAVASVQKRCAWDKDNFVFCNDWSPNKDVKFAGTLYQLETRS